MLEPIESLFCPPCNRYVSTNLIDRCKTGPTLAVYLNSCPRTIQDGAHRTVHVARDGGERRWWCRMGGGKREKGGGNCRSAGSRRQARFIPKFPKIRSQMHSADSRYIRPNASGLMRMYLIFQCIYSPSLIYPQFYLGSASAI
jgi:hypothetical protein